MCNDGVALFCLLHPESQAKKQRCLDLLRQNAREYYTKPEAKCTTWSYFTQFPNKTPVIGGLEMYTSKQALQLQVDDPIYFQSYHETVKKEGLYAKPEELVAWYQAGGFVARDVHAKPFGNVLISVTRMTTNDQKQVFDVLTPFSEWVKANEPDVLSYILFTRTKAPKEIMLVVRYKDIKAMKGHNVAPEHQAVIKRLSKVVEGSIADTTTMWQEVEDSFVSNVVGGGIGKN
ncbi:Hypothetical protein R9X50_00086900 [Acrodontium crateriforme]|uniref:ABM domain-containing protein n=1 Tax=Acrodontium crateriforme TaxID=150365 RepID=A0AAQ3LY33_9PEZI|nr:Hypothetical protein R9X50_00086900 [Acrodontium crateriforme]